MDIGLIIGSVGVFFLLLAFMLNLSGRLSERSKLYLTMNVIGAAMAAWYAWVGSVIPFVLLESTWAAVSLYRLFGSLRSTGPDSSIA